MLNAITWRRVIADEAHQIQASRGVRIPDELEPGMTKKNMREMMFMSMMAAIPASEGHWCVPPLLAHHPYSIVLLYIPDVLDAGLQAARRLTLVCLGRGRVCMHEMLGSHGHLSGRKSDPQQPCRCLTGTPIKDYRNAQSMDRIFRFLSTGACPPSHCPSPCMCREHASRQSIAVCCRRSDQRPAHCRLCVDADGCRHQVLQGRLRKGC